MKKNKGIIQKNNKNNNLYIILLKINLKIKLEKMNRV